ncbi:MAG: methyl-accepting chemotaxis protein [Bdellovibrio sp.]|nr:methyl-accepting chemotaxis protein [Bdellovibrio sp.]
MKTYSLQTKLFFLSSVLIIFSMTIGGISFWSENKISSSYSKIDEVSFPNTRSLLEAFSSYRFARVQLLQLAIPNSTPAQDQDSLKQIKANWDDLDKSVKVYLAVPFQPGEDELYNAWYEQVDGAKKEYQSAHLLDEKPSVIDARLKETALQLAMGPILNRSVKLRDSFNKLIEFHANIADTSSKEAKKANTEGKIWISSLIFGSLVFGFLFALMLSNSLVKTFRLLSNSLNEASGSVGNASTDIATSSQELSQATTQQAAALEQTAAAIEEMSSMVSKSSENAKSAADSSTASKNNAEKGKKVVEQMIQSMSEIDASNNNIMNQINHSNSEIEGIVRVIQEIGTKTKVINDIVFQTKLLSFNASVEAARAGENGKGFAVVAEEVGKLAQMSGNAAKEITQLLEGSIQKVERIIHETKRSVETLIADGKEKVQTGTDVANQCSVVLNEIVNSVSGVASMAEEIAAASREQAQGVAEITKAMQQLDQMTQQNAATSEESANSAESLSGQATTLKSIVNSLVVNIEGGRISNDEQPLDSAKTETKKIAKTESNAEPRAKVLQLKKKPTAPAAPQAVAHRSAVKSAVGDNSTPSHTNPGFKDI